MSKEKKPDNLHFNHRNRLRERFIKNGLCDFEPQTVLELLLFYAIPRKDTSFTAKRLMERFGSFSAVIEAPADEIAKADGINLNSAYFLKLLYDTLFYYISDKKRAGILLQTPEEFGEYLKPDFCGYKNEIIKIICLDENQRLVSSDFISEGDEKSSSLNIRDILQYALSKNARFLIIAHNHPSGVAVPSKADLISTEKLRLILIDVGIILLDHIIYDTEDYISFSDSKLLGKTDLEDINIKKLTKERLNKNIDPLFSYIFEKIEK